MSKRGEIAQESMKKLTERVIRSDLISRRERMIGNSARRFMGLLPFPLAMYALYQLGNVKGSLHIVENQSGDPYNFIGRIIGLHDKSFRELFRPEIYHQDKMYELQKKAKDVGKFIKKDENVNFKPYVWN